MGNSTHFASQHSLDNIFDHGELINIIYTKLYIILYNLFYYDMVLMSLFLIKQLG
jgi:hypothetical protein